MKKATKWMRSSVVAILIVVALVFLITPVVFKITQGKAKVITYRFNNLLQDILINMENGAYNIAEAKMQELIDKHYQLQTEEGYQAVKASLNKIEIKPNHGLESTGAPPAAGTPETHP